MPAMLGLVLLAFVASAPRLALAGSPRSGYELALHAGTPLLAGRPVRFRGIAYRVLGLAELAPLEGAQVRARYRIDGAGKKATGKKATGKKATGTGQGWVTTRADRRGFFQIELPMPKRPAGPPMLEVRVGDGKTDRRFDFDLELQQPWTLDLITDRQLYQAGETIHAWARLRDLRSRRPIARQQIHFTLAGTAVQRRPVLTDAGGVAALEAVVPRQASEGSYEVVARIGEEEVRRGYRIGVRTYERLFATVKVTPRTAQPHQRISVEVKVTTPSGAPVPNASITIKVDAKASGSGRTDRGGVATIAARAPAYMTHDTGEVPISVHVVHPAHGSVDVRHQLGLAVPLALEVEAVAPNAGLVPELDGPLYLKLQDGGGNPPPAGTRIEVCGAAVRGGRQPARTDAHGIAVVPTRLPPGAAAGGEDNSTDGATTTLVVQIKGAAPRTGVISVPVRDDVEVRPTVDKPVVAPGALLTIQLARRPGARRLPAVVELLSDTGLVDARVLAPGQDRIAIRAPRDRLGVIQVRVRALRQRGVVEGAGGLDAFIVRPAHPWFPTLRAEREVHRVRSIAHLLLETAPGGPRGSRTPPEVKGWATLLVRDLAAHGGEQRFELFFMGRAFDRAILDPSSHTAGTLLRTALAAYVQSDATPAPAPALLDALRQPLESVDGLESSPGRGVMRDPYPLADELRRRGVGKVMTEVEKLLASALDDGRLDEVTRGRGAARRFRDDLLQEVEDVPETLGQGTLTVAMLQAADPSFTYSNVARRVARGRLVRLLVALAHYLDPGDDATPQQRSAAREPAGRWLGRMVERGLIPSEDLADPWGGRFTLRKSGGGGLMVAVEAAGLELVSPGPDGRPGTQDDVRDPFARAIPQGTPYAVASGEDTLMQQLASLSFDQEVIRRIQGAYKRVAAEVAEEEIGDAVAASVSAGLIGNAVGEAYGVGGLGLSGTGRGGGGSGAGTIGLGKIGTIGKGGGGGFSSMAGLAAIVRERFPPTLHFAPSIPLDPSGKTRLALKLSDAVTTYEVEAIVWSEDGWTWSARTRIRVDQEVVVDAPVPGHAAVGDVLRLPVRIGNRSAHDRRLTLAVFASEETPGVALFQRAGIVVPAGDALQVPVDIRLARPFDGRLLVAVRAEDGKPLDASRRPLAVQPAARRVRQTEETLAAGTGSLRLEVPARAIARDGAEICVRVGAGLFHAPADAGWAAWSDAWSTRPVINQAVLSYLRHGADDALARAVAASWAAGEAAISDRLLGDALKRLTRTLDTLARHRPDDHRLGLKQQVDILLGLAPVVATGQLHIRGEGAAANLKAILRALRREVSVRAGAVTDEPMLVAGAAAALAWTAPAGGDPGRVRELLRRVRRHQLQVGPHTWVSVERRDDVPVASALLALAELKLGGKQRAFDLIRTLRRRDAPQSTSGGLRSALQGGSSPEGPGDRPASRALARAVAALLVRGESPRSVTLYVDGRPRRLALRGGLARVPAPELSRPGSHHIRVEVPAAGAPVHLEAVTEYGLPWSVVPAGRGPLVTSIEGETLARDQRAKLVLVVRNLSPRSIGQPVLEVGLPAGAELDEDGRGELRRRTVAEPEATRGTLRLVLPGLPPGGACRLPLPLRWSTGGRLQGLGVVAFAADRPEDISVTRPRVWHIADSPAPEKRR